MMKLTATPVAIKEKQSRRGRTSRNKGSSFERVIAKILENIWGIELVRTPQSGGFAKNKTSAEKFRGDIVPADSTIDLALHIECKNSKTWSLPKWLQQSESDCPSDKVPVVIFHKHNTSTNYIAMDLNHFLSLAHKNAIVKKKVDKK